MADPDPPPPPRHQSNQPQPNQPPTYYYHAFSQANPYALAMAMGQPFHLIAPPLWSTFPSLFNLLVGGALENWPNFQTPLLLMKIWDLLDNMCVVVDLKFEQKIPSGNASSSSKTR
jgi:hypothetical protein